MIQTSSPIQQSLPTVRFHGKWILTPLRICTPVPIEAPHKRSAKTLNRDMKKKCLKKVFCKIAQEAMRIIPADLKSTLPEKALRSLCIA